MSDEFIEAVSNHHNINKMKKLEISTQIIALADLLVRRIGKNLTKYDYNDPSENKMTELLNIPDDMIIDILQETKEQVKALKS